MRPTLDYIELEKKYGVTINYPGKNEVTFRNKCMIGMRNIYVKIREKTRDIIPLTQMEEIFLGERTRKQKEKKVFIETEKPYYKIEFIHMVDYIPKEDMGRFCKEINKFKKKHVGFNFPVDEDDTIMLGTFIPGSFLQPLYSIGIKETSPLYKYISGIYIGFQELTTSLNTVIYTIQMKENIVEAWNKIFLDEFDDYYYLDDSNLKWHQFWKMGWSCYAGDAYKQAFIDDCVKSLKWNVLKILKKTMTIHLAGEDGVLPSINVYKTNIDGNSSERFWYSINVKSPRMCDFIKDHSGCINWANSKGELDYIYRENGRRNIFSIPMDIRYYYSQYLIRNAILNDTYIKVGKYMEIMKVFNEKWHPLKKWLSFKTDAVKETLYYERFYNEQKPVMYDVSDFEHMFLNYNKGTKSISEEVIKEQYEEIQEASEVLKQTTEYISTNIESRNSSENYRIQRQTMILTFLSMTVATLALVVSCITSENISSFIFNNRMQLFKWAILIFAILMGVKIIINRFQK